MGGRWRCRRCDRPGRYAPVRYRGFSVRVPRSWPVFNLARDPQTCLRFDRHALCLGTPGREERCPARAVGRTEATSFSVRSAGVEVTATWSRAPHVVSRALGRKSLPRAQQLPASAAGSVATNASEQPASSSGAVALEHGLLLMTLDRKAAGTYRELGVELEMLD